VKKDLLEVKELKKYFTSGIFRKNIVKAVDGVSFHIRERESLGLVGESGCGKSTLGRCVVRLLEPTEGTVYYKGRNLRRFHGNMKELRRSLQIIFQDADGSLNPRMKAMDLLAEPLRVHKLLERNGPEKVMALMRTVNLTPDLMDRYPYELSGGQRQRIGIARAICLKPDLIVADEAAASLDLLVQCQMLELFKHLKVEQGTSFLYISHNLHIVRNFTDRVAVMYLGRLVELAKTQDIFEKPRHPYTRALITAMPKIDFSRKRKSKILEGEPPSPINPPSGCSFHPRCFHAIDRCSMAIPEMRSIGNGHRVACHLVDR
jgi:oligopeptide/dipeptide ABC transporter ATP-binding protein